MSTQIQDNNGVSITRFSAGQLGVAFQVTWRSTDPNSLFDWVEFKEQADAEAFAALLEQRLVR